MKNTLLITKFFPPERGGIQSYLYNLVLGLEKKKIFVFCHWNPSESQELHPAFAGIPIYRANFESPWRFLHLTTFDLFFKTRRIIKQQKIEKILCGHLPIAGPLAFLIKKFYGIPYLIFTHGMEIFGIKKLGMQKQKMFMHILHGAEKIIVTTDFMAGYLERKFGILPKGEDKIVKIPPGVDINKFKIQNSKFKITIKNLKLENYKIILTCGRLVARKNHISVIRAMPQIIKKIPNVLYLIAGTGPEEKTLRAKVKKLHLENYVKFLAEIPEKDLPGIYSLADLFVMPSHEISETGDVEGFGVVFLEAAVCGLPCIAGNTGGQGEAIKNGKTGFLVNPNNIDEIVNAIIKILQNPALAHELGQAGRDRAVREFNWKTRVEKLKQIL